MLSNFVVIRPDSDQWSLLLYDSLILILMKIVKWFTRPQFLWQTILDQTEEHFEVNQRKGGARYCCQDCCQHYHHRQDWINWRISCVNFSLYFFIKARDQTEEHFEVKQRSSRKQEEQTKVSQSTPPLFHTQSDANKMETYEMNRLFSFSHYCWCVDGNRGRKGRQGGDLGDQTADQRI